jgi:hypothetical protein
LKLKYKINEATEKIKTIRGFSTGLNLSIHVKKDPKNLVRNSLSGTFLIMLLHRFGHFQFVSLKVVGLCLFRLKIEDATEKNHIRGSSPNYVSSNYYINSNCCDSLSTAKTIH